MFMVGSLPYGFFYYFPAKNISSPLGIHCFPNS